MKDGFAPFFTQSEVAKHNRSIDFYVSVHWKVCTLWIQCFLPLYIQVFDLTPIAEQIAGSDIFTISQLAGTDVTSLFDFGAIVPICSMPGPLREVPWWTDDKLVVGRLTREHVSVRFVNTLTLFEVEFTVPCEWTLGEIIRNRLSHFNTHTSSYIFKHLDRILNESRTLPENGVVDVEEHRAMSDLGIPAPLTVPTIFMHFVRDDLEVK
jgi:hypothetical protein